MVIFLSFIQTGRLTIDDMANSGKRAVEVWGGTSYKLPLPYLRTRDVGKKPTEEKKSRFVPAPGDGPQYVFSKAKKGMNYHINVYGKDGSEPPASYLPYKEWNGKKTDKKDDGKATGGGWKKDSGKMGRGSFVDGIFFNGKKYNYPGPDKYFSEAGHKAKQEQKDAEKAKEKKTAERPNFLSDYQYLGLNIPSPDTYNFKDTWAASTTAKKPVSEEKKKPAYVPGSWRAKNDKGQAPGQYEVTRIMTMVNAKDAEDAKGKSVKKFASIPVLERPTLGVINKVFLYFSKLQFN